MGGCRGDSVAEVMTGTAGGGVGGGAGGLAAGFKFACGSQCFSWCRRVRPKPVRPNRPTFRPQWRQAALVHGFMAKPIDLISKSDFPCTCAWARKKSSARKESSAIRKRQGL